jgi:hypothetical protein
MNESLNCEKIHAKSLSPKVGKKREKKIMGDKCTLRMHGQFLYIGVKV